MVNVVVTVYKDMTGVCTAGYTKAVSSLSTVYSVEKVYMSDSPMYCDGILPAYKMLLKISDPALGILWIDETASSFADLIGEATSAGGGTGGTDIQSQEITTVAATQSQVFSDAVGATKINAVTVDGIEVYSNNYTFTSGTGTILFDAVNVPIGIGTKINIIFTLTP